MKTFNAWYYSFSPYVADFISKQPLLKEVMKILLYPLIGMMLATAILVLSTLTLTALATTQKIIQKLF